MKENPLYKYFKRKFPNEEIPWQVKLIFADPPTEADIKRAKNLPTNMVGNFF